MLNVKSFQIENFIPAGYQDAAAPRLAEAQEKLQKHTGLGSEFTDWVRLPVDYDKEEFARIQAAAKKIQGDSKALVVIGIGGSYLGARGVVEYLCSPNYNQKKNKKTPNIYFVGNGLSADDMRKMGDFLRDKEPGVAALLAGVNDGKITFQAVCGKEAVARGVKAGDIIKAIAPVCGGKGGGKPDSAMGGGTDVLKLDDALAMVDDFVAGKLN